MKPNLSFGEVKLRLFDGVCVFHWMQDSSDSEHMQSAFCLRRYRHGAMSRVKRIEEEEAGAMREQEDYGKKEPSGGQ